MYFQQDDCLAHNAIIIRNHLNIRSMDKNIWLTSLANLFTEFKFRFLFVEIFKVVYEIDSLPINSIEEFQEHII